jgi:hypothetical protein
MGESTVMLSAAKHLDAHRDRPFAEFTLSETNVLRVTVLGPISQSIVIFETPLSALGGFSGIRNILLNRIIAPAWNADQQPGAQFIVPACHRFLEEPHSCQYITSFANCCHSSIFSHLKLLSQSSVFYKHAPKVTFMLLVCCNRLTKTKDFFKWAR